jgi:hypothetical protein
MKFLLGRVDSDEAYELHQLAFAADHWPGDDHTYWIARNSTSGDVAGFCSAVYWHDIKCVYLSRSAVTVACKGFGLQRAMIAARVKWAMEETNARIVWSYCHMHNYPSVVNLIRSAFKFVELDKGEWHKFALRLDKKAPVKRISRAAWNKVDD